MALPIATITYDLSDYGDIDFDARRTRVYATTNIPNDVVVDTAGNQIHLGGTTGVIAADGTGSINVKVPAAGSNPVSWQTYIHVDYSDRTRRGDRTIRTFGPYSITTSVDLADLVALIPAPPEIPTAITLAAADANYVGKGTITLNVADYGAVGNGTNDDTTAIQSALTAARAAKAPLQFGFNKTYIVSATLNPTGVRIEGFGATIKVKPSTTPTYNIFQSTGPFTASDLTIDLNKANTTDPGVNSQGIGIYAFAASGWTTGVLTLRDVRVINGHQIGVRIGTTFAGTDSTTVSNTPANLEGVSIDGCKYGIWLQNVAGVKITAAEISNVGADAIWDFMSRDTQVIGGRIDTPGGHGFVSQYSLGALVSGLRVNSAGNMGIVFGGGVAVNEVCRNFTIQGCVVRSCVSNGFSVDPTKTGSATTTQNTWATITGNVADSNGMHGFYLHNVKYATLTGNVAKNQVGASAGGIALDSFGCTITGNVLIGNTYGMKFQGAVVGYGTHEVGRNQVAGNVTGQYFFDTNGADNTTLELQGTAIPAIAAPTGSTYRRTGGGAATTLYVKESGGVTTSGWVAK